MYIIEIIGTGDIDSNTCFEDVKSYELTYDKEAQCRKLTMYQDDSRNHKFVVYLGINDRVEVESSEE